MASRFCVRNANRGRPLQSSVQYGRISVRTAKHASSSLRMTLLKLTAKPSPIPAKIHATASIVTTPSPELQNAWKTNPHPSFYQTKAEAIFHASSENPFLATRAEVFLSSVPFLSPYNQVLPPRLIQDQHYLRCHPPLEGSHRNLQQTNNPPPASVPPREQPCILSQVRAHVPLTKIHRLTQIHPYH